MCIAKLKHCLYHHVTSAALPFSCFVFLQRGSYPWCTIPCPLLLPFVEKYSMIFKYLDACTTYFQDQVDTLICPGPSCAGCCRNSNGLKRGRRREQASKRKDAALCLRARVLIPCSWLTLIPQLHVTKIKLNLRRHDNNVTALTSGIPLETAL